MEEYLKYGYRMPEDDGDGDGDGDGGKN